MTEIYLYCSITYTNNCNNSYSLKSSFEKMPCIQKDFLLSMIDPTFSKCTSLHLAKSSAKGFFAHPLYYSGVSNWCLACPAS